MTESDPTHGFGELEPSKLQLRGPNVTSTFDKPLRADALKAQEAAIRKHLHDHRPGADPADPPEHP
jgi:hypothetical protein